MYNNPILVESHNIANIEKHNSIDKSMERTRAIRENEHKSIRLYPSFLNKVKTYFIVEGMMFTIDQAMKNDNNITYDKTVCRNILEGYVNKRNPDIIIREMEEKTMYLSNMANIIKESVEAVEEKCNNVDCNTFNIKSSTNTEFFDKLNTMSNDQLSKSIHKSVLKATEEYVEGVMQDKKNMDETAQKIKAKVDELKTDNQEVKESYYQLYDNTIKTNRKERPKNLLESIIVSISENAHKNESLKESFIVEGKTNFDKVTDIANGIYLTLEAMNSTRLQIMDKALFEEVLTNISSLE